MLLTTKQAAVALGLQYQDISRAIFADKVTPPDRVGNVYLWDEEALERLSWALRRRSADDILPQEENKLISK